MVIHTGENLSHASTVDVSSHKSRRSTYTLGTTAAARHQIGEKRKRKHENNRRKLTKADEHVEIVMETIVECSGDLTSTLPSLLIVNSLIDL